MLTSAPLDTKGMPSPEPSPNPPTNRPAPPALARGLQSLPAILRCVALFYFVSRRAAPGARRLSHCQMFIFACLSVAAAAAAATSRRLCVGALALVRLSAAIFRRWPANHSALGGALARRRLGLHQHDSKTNKSMVHMSTTCLVATARQIKNLLYIYYNVSLHLQQQQGHTE